MVDSGAAEAKFTGMIAAAADGEGGRLRRPYQVVLPAANGVMGRDLLPLKAGVGGTPQRSCFSKSESKSIVVLCIIALSAA